MLPHRSYSFFKTLKEHFAGVQTALFKKVKVMEEIFDQMNDEVDQKCTVASNVAEIERKTFSLANENLELLIVWRINCRMIVKKFLRCLDLEAEMSKIKNLEHQIQEKDNVIRDLKVLVSNVNDRSCEPCNANDVTALIEQNECVRVELEEAQLEGNLKVAARSSVKTKVLAPGMYAIDVEPIPPRLKNNRNAHLTYINHLKESVETVREIVKKLECGTDHPMVSGLRLSHQTRLEVDGLLYDQFRTEPKMMFGQTVFSLVLHQNDVWTNRVQASSSLGLHCTKDVLNQISSNLVSQMSQRRLLASPQAPFLKVKKGVRFSALYLQQKRNLLVLDHSHQQVSYAFPGVVQSLSGQRRRFSMIFYSPDDKYGKSRYAIFEGECIIGKGNLLLDLQKLQKNPIFCISVDIRQNTNYVRAFTTSANVPSIYIQLFWNTLTHDKALNVTLADSDQPFESPLQWMIMSTIYKKVSSNEIGVLRPYGQAHVNRVAIREPASYRPNRKTPSSSAVRNIRTMRFNVFPEVVIASQDETTGPLLYSS
ncbi:hypothetical protein Tco_0513238 [Tanacetum coccineum]